MVHRSGEGRGREEKEKKKRKGLVYSPTCHDIAARNMVTVIRFTE
jgi:ribosomal protein S8E